MINTQAFVISKVKYGDSGLIVKCFTRELGIRSYLLKGILSSKKGKLKAAYFQYLTLIEITVSDRTSGSLGYIKEVKLIDSFYHTQTDFTKQTLILFLAELLNTSLQEEAPNIPLFSYLTEALKRLDESKIVTDFHLVFALGLTRFLGFYPDTSNMDRPFFDLQEAIFTSQQPSQSFLAGDELADFKKLLGTNFDATSALKLTNTRRRVLLNTVIRYFELHLYGFRKPKSLAVLNEVFQR